MFLAVARLQAVCQNHTSVVKILLKQEGIDASARDKELNTPAHYCCRFVNLAMLNLLLPSIGDDGQ